MTGQKSKKKNCFNDFVSSCLQSMGPSLPQPPSPFSLEERRPRPANNGLFHEALGGEAGVLYYDAMDRPDIYDERMIKILSEMVSGERKYPDLSPEEQTLLNQAAAQYVMSPKHTKEEQTTRRSILKDVVRKLEPAAPPPLLESEDAMPPYWWLQGDGDGNQQDR